MGGQAQAVEQKRQLSSIENSKAFARGDREADVGGCEVYEVANSVDAKILVPKGQNTAYWLGGTGANGEYIAPHIRTSSGELQYPHANKDIRITEIQDLASVLKLEPINSDKNNTVFKRFGFSGRYYMQEESDGTLSVFYSGGQHINGKNCPAQTLHHGYWDPKRRHQGKPADIGEPSEPKVAAREKLVLPPAKPPKLTLQPLTTKAKSPSTSSERQEPGKQETTTRDVRTTPEYRELEQRLEKLSSELASSRQQQQKLEQQLKQEKGSRSSDAEGHRKRTQQLEVQVQRLETQLTSLKGEQEEERQEREKEQQQREKEQQQRKAEQLQREKEQRAAEARREQNWRNLLGKREQQLKGLGQQLGKLQSELAGWPKRLREQEARHGGTLEASNQQLQKLQKQLEELQRELERSRSKQEQSDKERSDADKAAQKLQEQLERLAKQLEELKTQREETIELDLGSSRGETEEESAGESEGFTIISPKERGPEDGPPEEGEGMEFPQEERSGATPTNNGPQQNTPGDEDTIEYDYSQPPQSGDSQSEDTQSGPMESPAATQPRRPAKAKATTGPEGTPAKPQAQRPEEEEKREPTEAEKLDARIKAVEAALTQKYRQMRSTLPDRDDLQQGERDLRELFPEAKMDLLNADLRRIDGFLSGPYQGMTRQEKTQAIEDIQRDLLKKHGTFLERSFLSGLVSDRPDEVEQWIKDRAETFGIPYRSRSRQQRDIETLQGESAKLWRERQTLDEK